MVDTLIEYWTPWTLQGQQISLCVGLANLVAANTILGLPFLVAAKCTQIFDKNLLSSAAFREQFDVTLSRPSTDSTTKLRVSVNVTTPLLHQLRFPEQNQVVRIAGSPTGDL